MSLVYLRSMPDFWPTTVAGWIALILSIVSVVLVPVGYGKWLEKMNGLGGRVKLVEDDQAQATGADVQRQLDLGQILNQHADLIRLVGEAKKTAEQCNESIEQHSLEMGVRVSETLAAVRAMELAISQRLTAVETELRVKRES